MGQASIVVIVAQIFWGLLLIFKQLRGRVREHLTSYVHQYVLGMGTLVILTFTVIDEGTNGLETKILGHEFADFAEQTSKASLSAHFRCEL